MLNLASGGYFLKEVSSCAESFLSELLRRPWDQALLSPAPFLHPRKLRARNPRCSLKMTAIFSPSSAAVAAAVGVSEEAAGAGVAGTVLAAAVIAASIFRIAQVSVPVTATRHRAAHGRRTANVSRTSRIGPTQSGARIVTVTPALAMMTWALLIL
jgi:hypothetical protein